QLHAPARVSRAARARGAAGRGPRQHQRVAQGGIGAVDQGTAPGLVGATPERPIGVFMNKLGTLEREGLRQDLPDFRPGDTIKVMVKVKEGDKERLQAFEGTCTARRGGGISETFTVRKVSAGVGVER